MLCSYGIIGCYLSHAKLWKQLAQDTSTEYYLVLEDDARFTDDTVPVIKEALAKFHGGFDLMTLFTFSDNMAVACYSDSLMNGKYQVCRNPMLLSTLGYIISKQGALNLLERLGPKASYHVDFMLNLSQLKGIRYLSVSPNVLINDGWLESNVLEGVEITSPADWGLKAIVFSIHQKVNVRNGHFYALILLILTFTILAWLGWWFKLLMLVTCTVLFLVTPF
jgi:GR25 family glycosyltransferase involved in LPS biosynthesis